MKPTVPAAPKMPCAVDDRPTGELAATTAYRAGLSIANPVASMRIIGTARSGSDDPRVGEAHDRRQDRPDDDERQRAAPVDQPAGERRQQQHRQPEHREGQPDQVEAGPELLEEEAPDDLVRPAGEVAAGVDDQGRDQAPVPESPRDRRAGRLAGASIGVDGGGGPPGRRWRLGRELGRVGRRGRMRPRFGLAPAQPDRDRRQERGDGPEHEHERDPAEAARRRAHRSRARAAARPSAPRRTGRTPRRDGRAASHRSGSRARPGRRRPSPARPRRARGRTRAAR